MPSAYHSSIVALRCSVQSPPSVWKRGRTSVAAICAVTVSTFDAITFSITKPIASASDISVISGAFGVFGS